MSTSARRQALVLPLIGAIDQGTTSTRFIVFDKCGAVVASAQRDLKTFKPQKGWAEQDALTILEDVEYCVDHVCQKLYLMGVEPAKDIAAIGITNQRETTVLWDAATGRPLHHAIVWSDNRTMGTVEDLIKRTPTRNERHFQYQCGLPITTYFSAVKARWLFDQSLPAIEEARREDRLRFSTIDTWLIWNLTGGLRGGKFVTDVTNASRTMLMNISSLQWDDELCMFFGVPKSSLPEIRSSSEVYGTMAHGPLQGVPISGCAGDQQAALVGHRCFGVGDIKSTYGTGCFVLYNTGKEPIFSKAGLLTTLAYQLGPGKKPVYALEGSVAACGSVLEWLKDEMGLVTSVQEIEAFVEKAPTSDGVYFVPALAGLYAPRWRVNAKGTIVGMRASSNKYHLCRAALEGISLQVVEVINAMASDSNTLPRTLKVDGGVSKSNAFMQIQADLLDCTIERPENAEMTALGAATLAGLAVGTWSTIDELTPSRRHPFRSSMAKATREALSAGWSRAVQACLTFEDNDSPAV